MNKFQSNKVPVWFYKTAFIAGIVLLAAMVFHPLFVPGRCLFTTDDNLGMIPSLKNMMPQGFFGNWGDSQLLGNPGGRVPVMWTPIFLWLLPEQFGFNWIHAIDLILASIALSMFLRAAGLRWPAIALGVITAFWVGSNLTLTYAGHTGKFGLLVFAAMFLFGIRKMFESEHPWLWSIITGGFIGLMFLEQQDVALFFGLFFGSYALFRAGLLFRAGTRLKSILLFIPMGAVALIISGSFLMYIYTRNISATDAAQQDNPRQKWEFATQWSWPPEESIDFIAPGYMGWRSGEQDGPYWGRMGRSPGWEQTGRGFMNFKLENQYIGAIPLIFASFAVFAALFGCNLLVGPPLAARRISPLGSDGLWRAGSPQELKQTNEMPDGANIKPEIIFWFCAAILALLLSFGKCFPLYYLFYQLPLVGEIRNPNKFLQVFQLALGILTAYGAHLVFNWNQAGPKVPGGKP